MSNAALILPDLPISEQVKIEALAHSRSRECARQLSATVKGPGAQSYQYGDRLKEICDQLDAQDAEERRRAYERQLQTPSGLIAEMRRSWPGQNKAVHQLAERLGVGLGEAWALVITAGVEAVTKKRPRKA